MTDSELLEAAKSFYFKRYPRRHRSEWQMPQDMADFALSITQSQAVEIERLTGEVEKLRGSRQVWKETDLDLQGFSVYLNTQILNFIPNEELVREARRFLEDLFGDVDRGYKALSNDAG